MYARVASFEGGDTEQLRQMMEERMAAGTMDLPAGVQRTMALEGDGRRLFITFFDSREAIDAAAQQFDRMGDDVPEDARGRRTSIEVYEVVYEG